MFYGCDLVDGFEFRVDDDLVNEENESIIMVMRILFFTYGERILGKVYNFRERLFKLYI